MTFRGTDGLSVIAHANFMQKNVPFSCVSYANHTACREATQSHIIVVVSNLATGQFGRRDGSSAVASAGLRLPLRRRS